MQTSKLLLLITFPLLLISSGLLANGLFPSPLQLRDIDGEEVSSLTMTFNGNPTGARLMPDIDGDGRAEWYFNSPDPIDPDCSALTIAMSTVSFGSDFTTQDLANMMTIRSGRSVNEDGTVTEGCRFITAIGVLDDINGDGIGEINAPFGVVVLGSVQPGAVIDIRNLNGLNGFLLGSRPISVGDLNGDGFNDVSTGVFGTGTRIYAGRSQFPAAFDSDDDAGDSLLFEYDFGSTIRPIGDFDGDGFDDLVIQGANSAGKFTSIVYGSSDMNLHITNVDQITQNLVNDCVVRFCAVGPAGDFDNDGIDDIVVSARDEFEGNAESAIVYGASSGFPTSETIRDIPQDRKTMLFSNMGSNVFNRVDESRLVSDINGDGLPEVFIEFNFRDVLLFPTPGRRLAAMALDTLDGSDGIFILPDNIGLGVINYFVDDVDDDGLPDLFYIDRYMSGLSFPEPRVPQLKSVVRQSSETINLFWQGVEATDIYRITFDGRVEAILSNDARSIAVDDPTAGVGGLVLLEAVDDAGVVLANAIRRIRPASDNPFNLTIEVYGDRLLELFFEPLNNQYLIVRNGEVIARQVYGGSYLDETVEPGQFYEYTIMPDLLVNESDDLILLNQAPSYQRISNTVSVRTTGEQVAETSKLTPPVNLTGEVYSSSALEFSWVRSTGANAVIEYVVYRNGQILASTNGNSYFDSGLLPGTEYTYTVLAKDTTAVSSDLSTPIVFTTNGERGSSLMAPTGFRAAIYGASVIELFWDRQQVAGIRYNVFQDGALIANTDGTSTLVENLTEGQQYTFSLSAVVEGGSETLQAELMIGDDTGSGPDTPTSVIADVYGSKLVEVFWDRMADAATYNVYVDEVLTHNTNGTSQLLPLDGMTSRLEVSISAIDSNGAESTQSENILIIVQ